MAHTGKLTAPIKSAQATLQSFGKSIGGVFTGLAGKLAALTAGVSAIGLAKYAVQQASLYEDAMMAFTTFLRSAEKAKSLMADLTNFSDITPFTAEQVQVAARGLLAFGFAAGDVIPTLQYLGDAAAGSQQDINELVNILGKVRSKGKLQLEELNRFTERGIVLIPELAKIMGVTEKEVYNLVSSGKLGFAEVERALKNLNSEGGIFQGAMENLSTTLSGRLSTLKSKFATTMREIGQIFLDAFDVKGALERFATFIDTNRQRIVDAVSEMIKVIEYAKTAWAALQLAGTFAIAAIVDAAAWLIDGFEFAINTIGRAFTNLWSGVRMGFDAIIVSMIESLAGFLQGLESSLPKSLRLGLGDSVSEFARTFASVTEMQRKAAGDNKWVDVTMGGDVRQFADNLWGEAEKAYDEFLKYANRDIGKKLAKDAEKAAEDISTAVSGVQEQLVAPQTDLSAVAVERGSQEAFKAILETTKKLPVEEQQLEQIKRSNALLSRLEQRGIVLRPAGIS